MLNALALSTPKVVHMTQRLTPTDLTTVKVILKLIPRGLLIAKAAISHAAVQPAGRD